MSAEMLTFLGGFSVLGAAMGGLYLYLLRVNTCLYLGGGPWWQPIALHLARMAVVIAGFAAIAAAGAGAVLAAFAGFLLARTALIRPMGKLHG